MIKPALATVSLYIFPPNFRKPIMQGPKYGKASSAKHYIMKMAYNKVGIVEVDIGGQSPPKPNLLNRQSRIEI